MSLGKSISCPDVRLKARTNSSFPPYSSLAISLPSTFAMSNTELVSIAPPSTTTVLDDNEERTSPRPEDIEDDPTTRTRAEQELAPVDGGPAAWKLLCAAFVFETLLWGKTRL
jgi:hypothetical protein